MSDPQAHHATPSYGCECRRQEFRRRVISNGVVVVGNQCLGCGKWLGRSKAGIDVDALPAYDPAIADDYSERRRATYLLQREAEQAERRRRYDEYMRSSKWQELRALVMRRAGERCEGCGLRRAVQVHHLTYERLGDEMLFDLVAVCIPCHEKIHASREMPR